MIHDTCLKKKGKKKHKRRENMGCVLLLAHDSSILEQVQEKISQSEKVSGLLTVHTFPKDE